MAGPLGLPASTWSGDCLCDAVKNMPSRNHPRSEYSPLNIMGVKGKEIEDIWGKK